MISSINGILNNSETVKTQAAKTGDDSFKAILTGAKKLVDQNIEAERGVKEATVGLMTGENDNIHSLLIAQEKSNILLQYTLKLRKGVVDAYNEIMKMSI